MNSKAISWTVNQITAEPNNYYVDGIGFPGYELARAFANALLEYRGEYHAIFTADELKYGEYA